MRLCFLILCFLSLSGAPLFAAAHSSFQGATSEATAPLHDIKVDGLTKLTQEQVIALTGLQIGSQVGRPELQAAANRLYTTGLFKDVKYEFSTNNNGVSLSYHVAESPRLPVLFDNIPWFGDSELNAAIRAKLPFYDGTLPEGGNVLSIATDAVRDLIDSHKLNVTVQLQIVPNPIGDGSVQEFTIEGPSLRIAKLEFSDPALADNRAVQQHLSEIIGKPFSRMYIDVFLSEHIRPIYTQQGYLRVKLGPAQIRLTGDPNLPLPTEIPVYIPIVPGPVYHFTGATWSGNNAMSSLTLDSFLGSRNGQVADEMALEGAWERIGEEYGRRGYLEAKISPDPSYDDSAHTISYKVQINEGRQYRMGGFVLTGISPTGEDKIRSTFPIAAGEIFDKIKYEDFLTKLENHSKEIFGDLPIHYDEVGHWLRTDAEKSTVDVLLDFK